MRQNSLIYSANWQTKKKGSKNREKMRVKIARLHAKIADCRMDATHKASRTLINENQVVCVETLRPYCEEHDEKSKTGKTYC